MINQKEYKTRRQKLSQFINEGVLILPGNISYIRNHDVELQRIIKVKMSDDIKNRRNRSGVKPRSFPWRCKVYRCEP